MGHLCLQASQKVAEAEAASLSAVGIAPFCTSPFLLWGCSWQQIPRMSTLQPGTRLGPRPQKKQPRQQKATRDPREGTSGKFFLTSHQLTSCKHDVTCLLLLLDLRQNGRQRLRRRLKRLARQKLDLTPSIISILPLSYYIKLLIIIYYYDIIIITLVLLIVLILGKG